MKNATAQPFSLTKPLLLDSVASMRKLLMTLISTTMPGTMEASKYYHKALNHFWFLSVQLTFPFSVLLDHCCSKCVCLRDLLPLWRWLWWSSLQGQWDWAPPSHQPSNTVSHGQSFKKPFDFTKHHSNFASCVEYKWPAKDPYGNIRRGNCSALCPVLCESDCE